MNIDREVRWGARALHVLDRVGRFTLEVREMLERLNDQLLQKIAVRKLEGYTNQEIAGQMGIALRAVERKLRLIRQKWESVSYG